MTIAESLDTRALAALVELAHDAVLVRAPNGRIVYWNRGAVDLYGWTREEAIGRISHELLATRFPDSLAELERALVEEGGWEGRLEHVTKSGRRVVVESRWAPQCDAAGKVVAALEINRDVTDRLTVERELAAEAARFRAFFESSLDAMFLTAPDGRVFAANPAAVEMYGFSEEEIVAGGRELVVDATDPRLAAAMRARDDHGRIRAEIRGRRRDGSKFESEFTSVVYPDASGELRTSMVVRDVTARTRALEAVRESEARFQALADAAFESVFIHDGGRIVAANRAACVLYGFTEEELTTKSLRDLVSPEEVPRVEAIIAAGEEGPYETEVIAVDGRRVPVEVSARSIAYEGRPMRVTAMRDITDRRQAQRALEEQNERLREISALKTEFLALVSHELRTPLTSISAYVDALLAGEAGEPTDRQRRYLTIAARNATRLRRFVEDLLFAAHAESGAFALELGRVEVAPLVREVVDSFRPNAEASGVSLHAVCSAAPVVVGDRDRLVQLLDNLVSNALKFTSAGGTVEVRAAAAETALISVSDTGPGIPADEVPHLFERFYRGTPAVAASKPGAGLGLAIVGEIVAAHQGTIRVESDPGRGSTFVVELPLAS